MREGIAPADGTVQLLEPACTDKKGDQARLVIDPTLCGPKEVVVTMLAYGLTDYDLVQGSSVEFVGWNEGEHFAYCHLEEAFPMQPFTVEAVQIIEGRRHVICPDNQAMHALFLHGPPTGGITARCSDLRGGWGPPEQILITCTIDPQ